MPYATPLDLFAGGIIPSNAPITVVEMTVTFMDTYPPGSQLLFGAMQMSFMNASNVNYGGNHFGLQWNFGSESQGIGKAVNFGGYVDPPGRDAGVPYEFSDPFYVDVGTNYNRAVFPGLMQANDRTCGYDWTVGIPVHFRIEMIGGGTWRCTVDGIVFRDSYYPGTTHADGFSFWTELGFDFPCRAKFSQVKFIEAGGTEYHVGPVFIEFGANVDERCVYLDETGLIMHVGNPTEFIAAGSTVTMPYVSERIKALGRTNLRSISSVNGVPKGYVKSVSKLG